MGRLAWLVLALALAGCAQPPAMDPAARDATLVRADPASLADPDRYRTRAQGAEGTLRALLTARSERIVVVAERHDQLEDHLVQLAVLRALRQAGAEVAVGMEWFQSDVQPALRAYNRGELDERGLLERTGYFDRWRYDYRLIRPVVRYARDRQMALVALNAPPSQVRAVSQGGWPALPTEVRKVASSPEQVPAAYRQRLRDVLENHPSSSFESFLAVQLLWDETMARNAAAFLAAHPQRRLVILAGRGHVAPEHTIPDRLQRLTGEAVLRVLPNGGDDRPDRADTLHVQARPLQLPPEGFLGVGLEPTEAGVRIASIQAGSAAEHAGLETGMTIETAAGVTVESPGDVLLGLYDKPPGARVQLSVRHRGERRTLTATLGEAP